MAETDGAGAPGPIEFELSNDEFGSDTDRVEAMLVLDLLGLLGVGRSHAERRRIDAEAALAVAELEVTVWRSWLDVEAARVRFVAAAERERRLEELVQQARADFVRVEVLFDAGWIGKSPAGAARAAVAITESMRSVMSETVTSNRAELVQLAGAHRLDTAIDELVQQPSASLESIFATGNSLDAEHLGDHPELRALRVEFLLREAEVRSVAASAWPGIGIGPRLGYEDELAIGSVLRLELPFPSSWRGRLAAAVERRDAVIDAYEDRVLVLLARARAARDRLDEIAVRRSDITTAVVEGSTVGWQGARATFSVGRLGVVEWVDALNRRREAVTAEIADAEAVALAVIDLAAARGPAGTRFTWEDEVREEVQP
jgi:outer membrane protein TolC